MIPPPTPAYIAQAQPDAVPADIETALRKRVGKVEGSVVVVGRRRGDSGRVDLLLVRDGPRAQELSRFEVGAVTEAVTGTLLASAVRRGELQYDEPIAGHAPAGLRPPAWNGRQITFRDLATHRSGLPRLPLRNAAQPYADVGAAQLYAMVSGAKLVAEPGTHYDPANVDFALLGALLAYRAGTPYAELARNRLFTPLAMTDTVADALGDRALVPERAITGVPVAPWVWNAFAGEGAVRSTARDLLRLAGELFAGTTGPVADDLRAAAAPTAAAGGGARIGLGWLTDTASGVVYASGSTYGATAFVGVAPARSDAVVILANVGLSFADASLDDLGLRLLAATAAPTKKPG